MPLHGRMIVRNARKKRDPALHRYSAGNIRGIGRILRNGRMCGRAVIEQQRAILKDKLRRSSEARRKRYATSPLWRYDSTICTPINNADNGGNACRL